MICSPDFLTHLSGPLLFLPAGVFIPLFVCPPTVQPSTLSSVHLPPVHLRMLFSTSCTDLPQSAVDHLPSHLWICLSVHHLCRQPLTQPAQSVLMPVLSFGWQLLVCRPAIQPLSLVPLPISPHLSSFSPSSHLLYLYPSIHLPACCSPVPPLVHLPIRWSTHLSTAPSFL